MTICRTTALPINHHLLEKNDNFPKKYQKTLPFWVSDPTDKELHLKYLPRFIRDQFEYESVDTELDSPVSHHDDHEDFGEADSVVSTTTGSVIDDEASNNSVEFDIEEVDNLL